MSLSTRVAVLERRADPVGACPVCNDDPPWGVSYDGAPPTGEPCPGCSGLQLIEVRYRDEGIGRTD